MKNLLVLFLLIVSLVSFSGCVGIEKTVKKIDSLTTTISNQWDAMKEIYIDTRIQVKAKIASGELKLPADLLAKLVVMDGELKKMDAVMQEIKLIKAVSKEQAANIKATTKAMADLVKLTIALM